MKFNRLKFLHFIFAAFLLSACGEDVPVGAKIEEISSVQEISSMSYTDPRLDTTTEWISYFELNNFEPYLEDEVVIRGVNDFQIITGWLTPTFKDPTPSTGKYSLSKDLTVCADGAYSASTGRGTCSWHGGIASYTTVQIDLEVIQIWICEDNEIPESRSMYLKDLGGHAFLSEFSCSDFGGARSIYTYGKHSVT